MLAAVEAAARRFAVAPDKSGAALTAAARSVSDQSGRDEETALATEQRNGLVPLFGIRVAWRLRSGGLHELLSHLACLCVQPHQQFAGQRNTYCLGRFS